MGLVVLLALFGIILECVMLFDCLQNRREREPYWLWVLALGGPASWLLLRPVGWLGPLVISIAYLAVHRDRFSLFSLLRGGSDMKAGAHMCSRCERRVARLEAYQDGRAVRYYCAMCRAELDILHADTLRPDN